MSNSRSTSSSPPAKKAKTVDEDKAKPTFLTPPNSASLPASCLTDEAAHKSSSVIDLTSSLVEETNTHPSLCRHTLENLLLTEANYNIADPSNTKKRSNYILWDDYFLGMAFLSAQRSKDPNNQVGACIVDNQNRIIGIGYNGFPRGCSDDCLPWDDGCIEVGAENHESGRLEKKLLHTRDPYMCHAEVNAILNKCSADVAGARMFVAQFPCNECAKIIIQSGIQEVIYMKNDNPEKDAYRASRIMFKMAGVKLRQYAPTIPSIELDFGHTTPASSEENDTNVGGFKPSDKDKSKYRDLLLKEAQFDPITAPITKRSGYLSWDSYFMAVAFLSAQRSKDPNTQVGACIVDANKCIVGIGYNGFPRGCSDEHLPWARQAQSDLHKKYPYVCHAEVNAILNKCSANVKGATLYVALFPCNDCAKVIIQAGIREVVYLHDYYHDTDQCRASRIMFRMSGVKLRQYHPEERIISINFGTNFKKQEI